MIQTIRKAWGIPELQKKIVFTLLILLIYRIGSAIPVPYVDTATLKSYLDGMGTTILGLYNVMSGGAFQMATVFALGIQPYINSSIIIQLLTVAIPALERMARDGGEEGKRKIQSITRYATVAIALLQGFGYYSLIKSYGLIESSSLNGVWVALVIVLSFTAGSAFLMWLGEQITISGIGNGISIILFAGIVSRFPTLIKQLFQYLDTGRTVYKVLVPVVCVIFLLMIAYIVFMDNSERRLPIQYAKRVVGRKMYGGQSTHIPIKVNMSGVMPIIFASTLCGLPNMIGSFLNLDATKHPYWTAFFRVFNYNSVLYLVVYVLSLIHI